MVFMRNLVDNIVELAVQIQQIAAPTFHEMKRAEFVRDRFKEDGLQDVTMDEAGNVYGRWEAAREKRNDSKPLVISAHLDTVFPFEMDLKVKREGDRIHGIGIGDNSLGVAALFGLIWSLREREVDDLEMGDIWFVANTCEEGLGDLRGMKAVADRFGAEVLAYLVLEGMALGHVYHKAVGVKRYRITAKTHGGHSWSDYGQPSAVLELSRLIVQLSALILPSQPRTTMNVGRINGGTSINTIPAEAWMELDLRSEGQRELAELIEGVDQLIEAANQPGVMVEAQVIGARPAGELSPKHPLVRLAQKCLREQGLDAALTSGSTDANIPLSRGYPALVLGVTKGSGAHTRNEYIEIPPIEKGMGQLLMFVEKAWE